MKYLLLLLLVSIVCIGLTEADETTHPSVFRQLAQVEKEQPSPPIWTNLQNAGKQVKSFMAKISDPFMQLMKFITDIVEKIHQGYRNYQRRKDFQKVWKRVERYQKHGVSFLLIPACTEALNIDPENEKRDALLFYRATAYFYTRDYDRAIEDCERVSELELKHVSSDQVALLKAEALWKLGGDIRTFDAWETLESITIPTPDVKVLRLQVKSRMDEIVSERYKGKDYYEALNIDRDATKADIRKAYFKLSRQLHPDRYSSVSQQVQQDKAKQFLVIRDAYEVLSNPTTKKLYDSVNLSH